MCAHSCLAPPAIFIVKGIVVAGSGERRPLAAHARVHHAECGLAEWLQVADHRRLPWVLSRVEVRRWLHEVGRCALLEPQHVVTQLHRLRAAAQKQEQ